MKSKINIRDYGIIIGFLILCTFISFKSPNFLKQGNVMNLLRQSSIIGIIATGMTFVIISGNFDLSVGAVAALSGAVTMTFLRDGHRLIVAAMAALLVGAVIGFINGVLVAKVNIPSLITTMAMVTITRGLLLFYTDGSPVSGDSKFLSYIGSETILGVPVPVVIFFTGIFLCFIILTYTKFGKRVYAVGGNEDAARLSGINVDKYKILVFVINGCFAALAGIVLVSRLGTATPVAGEGYELDSIASVVIGGTSVLGGEGNILMTVIGVLLISVISNSFNLLEVKIYFQYVFKGLIILAAVGLDSYSKKKK